MGAGARPSLCEDARAVRTPGLVAATPPTLPHHAMFVLPGLLALIVFIYARPFDFIPALKGVPFLYLFFGLAVFGYLVDLRQGKTDLRSTPHLGWVAAFTLWCFFTAGVKAP